MSTCSSEHGCDSCGDGVFGVSRRKLLVNILVDFLLTKKFIGVIISMTLRVYFLEGDD